MGTWIIIAVLLGLLAIAGWGAYEGWTMHSNVAMPASGYVAMALGVTFSIIVGCGLMALVFYSSRKGYDEGAQNEHNEGEDR
jgi:TRAP-type C4-dicarboxylate transport system permease small subunit